MSSSNLNALLSEGTSISDFFSDLNASILQAEANFPSIQVQVDSLLHVLSSLLLKKKAALKAAIESLPRVTVTAEEESYKACSICMEEFDIGSEAREMPCKHRFHSGCIEKWLRLRGSCPLCRYVMPLEEEEC